MKISKNERIWLIVVVILYLLYNFPGFPAYHQPVATVVHGFITVIAIWIAVYVGLGKVYKEYPLKEEEENK
ncbi:MAG: hypothetical protein IJH47_01985 [Oscillospiraceae bacterium]|nr:hypothetical protein [Oscillospiraceae bacterium]